MFRDLMRCYQFLFVAGLLGLLLTAGFYLDTSKTKSIRERRNLARPPVSYLFHATETEKYIADHFPLRDELINFYFESGFGSDFGTKNVLVGKNKWLFLRQYPNNHNYDNILIYQNKFAFSQKEKEKIIQNLSLIKKWCDDNHILFYLIVPPDKNPVYAHFMPDYILRDDKPSIFDQFQSFVPKNIALVSLEKELITAAQEPNSFLYYKTDAHWSEKGALLAYQLLMKRIQQDLPDVHSVSLDKFYQIKKSSIFSPYSYAKKGYFNAGNIMLPGLKGYDKPIYTHYEYKRKNDIQYVWDTQFRSSENKSPDAFPYRVYVIGDSYAAYLHLWLSATFKHVKAYRYNESGQKWGILFKDRQKEMLADKTNILILSVGDLKLLEIARAF